MGLVLLPSVRQIFLCSAEEGWRSGGQSSHWFQWSGREGRGVPPRALRTCRVFIIHCLTLNIHVSHPTDSTILLHCLKIGFYKRLHTFPSSLFNGNQLQGKWLGCWHSFKWTNLVPCCSQLSLVYTSPSQCFHPQADVLKETFFPLFCSIGVRVFQSNLHQDSREGMLTLFGRTAYHNHVT